jgi:hypothetical protein
MAEARAKRVANFAALLILFAAAASLAFGYAAITGAGRLEANVREIESTTGSGMWASLTTWGWILSLLAFAEAAAATAILAGNPHRLLAGQLTAYLGLIGAFFTLPIVREGGVVVIVLLLIAIYLITYRAGNDPEDQST